MRRNKMNRTPVKSSNLISVGFDKEFKTLEIEFHNDTYQYLDVPEEVHNGLIKAESKGKYFHEKIKSLYHCNKLGPDFKDFEAKTLAQLSIKNYDLGEIIYTETLTAELKKWLNLFEVDKKIVQIKESRLALIAFIRYLLK